MVHLHINKNKQIYGKHRTACWQGFGPRAPQGHCLAVLEEVVDPEFLQTLVEVCLLNDRVCATCVWEQEPSCPTAFLWLLSLVTWNLVAPNTLLPFRLEVRGLSWVSS